MRTIRLFVSFDLENDADLRDRLSTEASRQTSGFEVAARSEAGPVSEAWDTSVRRRMAGVDEVVVICGEHTQASAPVSAELRIAQEERKPYFLLWGRRELMCTKPAAAKPSDGMYSWTWDILRNQIQTTLRNAKPIEVPDSCRKPGSASA
jgi:hypothetical protein